MATPYRKRRPFPALVIVFLLLLFCLYPGQTWMAHFFPRLAGLATIDPGLIVLGIPYRLLFSIDLVLVPLLFLVLYVVIVMTYSIVQHQPVARYTFKRSAAVVSGVFFLVVCTAIGGLISYAFVEQLPVRIQHSIAFVGIVADIHLPTLGYGTNSLQGNILSLIGFLVGLVLFIGKITRDPQTHRTTPLTREQKMSPYQRMLEERRHPASPSPSPSFIPDDHAPYIPNTPPAFHNNNYMHCRNIPLQSLEPEAVNYRPLG